MPYVYSTLATDMDYAFYGSGGGDLPVLQKTIRINGGTGVADRKTLVTPFGAIVTEVSAEDMDLLMANHVFLTHEKNGFVQVSDKLADGEVAAAEMQGRDESAPKVEADFTEEEVPVIGKKK